MKITAKHLKAFVFILLRMRSPYEFARQFQEELQTDLGISAASYCSKCFITYVDGDIEGCCFYSYEEGSEKLPKKRRPLVLNCVYDYEDAEPQKRVNGYWIEGVMKALDHKGDAALVEKWKARFANSTKN